MQKTLSDIKNDIEMPGLKTSLRSAKAMSRKHKWRYLPVINNQYFVGNFSAEDIHCLADDDLVENHLDILSPFHLDEKFALMGAVEMMLENESAVRAICD